MPQEPDGELLRRFVHGDRDAFEILFRHFQSEVYRWIVRIVRDRAAAEDALIDAFWRAYRSRARFDPSRGFGAWMRRLATHAAIDQVHAARRRRWVPLAAGRVRTDAPVGADDQIDARDGTAIARAFASLSPRLQVVATLALIEERPQHEIAEALGVPIGTVKSRLFRATRLLRKELARLGVHT
jgi:RNA polymerase sigma-70 factor (ECF subfamily)